MARKGSPGQGEQKDQPEKRVEPTLRSRHQALKRMYRLKPMLEVVLVSLLTLITSEANYVKTYPLLNPPSL